MDVARRVTTITVAESAPRSLARGAAGLALLAGQLDACRPDLGWDAVAHTFVSAAARDADGAVLEPGLFGGLAGIGFAATTLARGGTRYQRLLAAVDRAIMDDVLSLRRPLTGGAAGMPVSHFDLMRGLSGIGAYLIQRADEQTGRAALEETLRELVTLATPAEPPRWWTPAHLLVGTTAKRRYPAGNVNCGLAHGIPGPLAVLALAKLAGVTTSGQDSAMRHLAGWLLGHRIEDRWGYDWPDAVPPAGDDDGGAGARPALPGSTAWCYGGPGVARALWLAGTALDDASLRSTAVATMEAACARQTHDPGVDSSLTFCHGLAGLLHLTLRFAHDTGDPSLTAAAGRLTGQLLSHYDPRRLFGFTSLEPDGRTTDRRGLLEGASGIALTLLAAATETPPVWDRAFVLA